MITLNQAIKKVKNCNGKTLSNHKLNCGVYFLKLSIGDDEYITVDYDSTLNTCQFTRFYNGKLGYCTLGQTSFYRLSREQKAKVNGLFDK